jgi:ABC-2 type transport system ATP-binding protein
LSQRFSLYGDLTVDENIDFFAGIHGIKDHGERKLELLQLMRLESFRTRLADKLSGGMKQKLALACTLIHRPDVIFLDEPTTGVDPVSRRDFWKILSSVLKAGIAIVMATPYLDEAERANRVALLNGGRLLVCDTPEAMKAGFMSDVVEIIPEDVRDAFNRLRKVTWLQSVQLFGDRLHIALPPQRDTLGRLNDLLSGQGIRVRSQRTLMPTLEDVFISRIS